MLPHAKACLVPVVTMVLSEMGTPASAASGKDLTFLLFSHANGKGEARVDAGMQGGHVVVQIRLADLGIGVGDVHEEGVETNNVEAFSGVVKNSVVDVVNCRCK
jgi:hypothetical protein